MNLEDMTLSEISQIQKDKYYMIRGYLEESKIRQTEGGIVVFQELGRGGRGWELLLSGCRVSVL